jgi:hypothetical protein
MFYIGDAAVSNWNIYFMYDFYTIESTHLILPSECIACCSMKNGKDSRLHLWISYSGIPQTHKVNPSRG